MIKKPLQWLMVLWIGIGVALVPGALTGWARPAPARPGFDHDHDRGRDHEKEHHDRGRHRGWERDRHGRYRFDAYDRRAVEHYYREHRDERWFRERAPRGLALGYGRIIEPRYRRYCRPLPVVMLRELPPPPYGYRYFFIGGNVVLVDRGYRVHDFIHIDINLGR